LKRKNPVKTKRIKSSFIVKKHGKWNLSKNYHSYKKSSFSRKRESSVFNTFWILRSSPMRIYARSRFDYEEKGKKRGRKGEEKGSGLYGLLPKSSREIEYLL